MKNTVTNIRLSFRMNCFGTTLYKQCIDLLLIEEDLKGELVKYIDDAHFGASVFNKK